MGIVGKMPMSFYLLRLCISILVEICLLIWSKFLSSLRHAWRYSKN